jgi:hypothetical protein
VTFNTFDGTQDKHLGSEFFVTPAFWNKVTGAGTKRIVNFHVTAKSNETEVKLISIHLNGGEEIRLIFISVHCDKKLESL